MKCVHTVKGTIKMGEEVHTVTVAYDIQSKWVCTECSLIMRIRSIRKLFWYIAAVFMNLRLSWANHLQVNCYNSPSDDLYKTDHKFKHISSCYASSPRYQDSVIKLLLHLISEILLGTMIFNLFVIVCVF